MDGQYSVTITQRTFPQRVGLRRETRLSSQLLLDLRSDRSEELEDLVLERDELQKADHRVKHAELLMRLQQDNTAQ